MVDALVSFVVERLGDFLIQEAVFLRGVRNEVKSLKKELEWMLCFVKDAEEKQLDDPMIHQWVSDIREVSHDIENVLDNFMLTVQDEGEGENQKRRSGFLAFIDIVGRLCDKEANLYRKSKKKIGLYDIGKEIEDLRKRVADISRRRESYGLQSIDNKSEGKSYDPRCRLKELRRACSFAVEENVVGFEDDFMKLLAKLLDKEHCRSVISIYGMGGLGKTTLARRLYHNNDVKNKFDCCAWVSVSQDYKTEDLLLSIIRSFKMQVLTTPSENTKAEDLERYLYKSLQGKSYLVVVDDVWHKEAWESLKRAFPDNKNGSRVIITTRIKDVAERSDERTYAHNLRFLRPDESWKLFCSKTFRSSDVNKGLENLGRDMVEKCHGLPLAIVVLGGLLSTKKPQEWRIVRDHIWRHLKNDSIHISHLLALSFNNLSYQLKLCFLYLGFFPEDFEINIQNLIRLFVAEGFIEQDTDRSMEEVARDNMDELINRSLVQIEKRCWGRVATCRVHDLLRDLAIEKAKQMNFIHICENSSSSRISSCPRQAVHFPLGWDCDLTNFNSLATSLLLFNQRWDPSIPLTLYLGPLCRSFRLLRVLDFDGIVNNVLFSARRCYDFLPEEIGKFIHLKYLRLRNAHVGGISSFIAKFQRLQTLDISGDMQFIELPREICKLKELRHLIGNFTGTLMIESLSNLQTLKYITDGSWSKINPEKLVNLRELRIEKAEAEEFSFDSIAKLKNLQLLSVNHASFGSLQPLSHCSRLVDLRLTGKIEKLPGDMHEILPNLQCLSLKKSCLKDDPMRTLEKLPNLTVLDLRFNVYCKDKMMCTTEGFHLLETLQLIELRVRWEVEEGAMPMLRSLRISDVYKPRIPERLKSLPPPAEWECDENW
ncbi:Disease resistance protein [Melia azedarach]|uniref:Disease resistance protein n=1 Tax=Melia azedarach TaxID=155640 RepID=A0ACC1YLL2_MELAZ|nr:Disease resistance protein [Melia azedarach]